jgi:hypothetical protein
MTWAPTHYYSQQVHTLEAYQSSTIIMSSRIDRWTDIRQQKGRQDRILVPNTPNEEVGFP